MDGNLAMANSQTQMTEKEMQDLHEKLQKEQEAKSLLLVTHETASKLFALNFQWDCRYFYNSNKQLLSTPTHRLSNWTGNSLVAALQDKTDHSTIDISAPERALALKWLRNVLGMDISINVVYFKNAGEDETKKYSFYTQYKRKEITDWIMNPAFDTYDEAENYALNLALDFLIREGKNNLKKDVTEKPSYEEPQ